MVSCMWVESNYANVHENYLIAFVRHTHVLLGNQMLLMVEHIRSKMEWECVDRICDQTCEFSIVDSLEIVVVVFWIFLVRKSLQRT